MNRDEAARRGWRRAAMAGIAGMAAAPMVAIGLVVGSAAAQQAVPPTALVFDRVGVVDVTDGTVRPDQRVVVVGNRIRTIGDAGRVVIPPSAQVVDAHGQYLIPGLWDMRTQLTADLGGSAQLPADLLAPLFILNGVTGIRNAWERSRAESHGEYAGILAGTEVGPPRQILVDFMIAADSANITGKLMRYRSPQGTTRAARSRSGKPEASFVQLDIVSFALLDGVRGSGMPAGGALIDYGKRYGLPSYNISAAQASDSGLTILEHIYLSGGLDTLCWAPAGNMARCRTIADHLRRNGTWFVPTIIGSFAEPIDPKITAPHARGVYDRWRRQLAAFRNGPIPHGNWLRDSADTKPDQATGAMAAIQQTPDFPLLAGTAGATHWISLYRSRPLASGFALHAELAMYVAEGLTPLRALQAATLNPAKLLHATDSLGTVAPGKLADLVLLDANPLDDITNTTAIRAVVADGRYYDRAALDQLWEKAKALAHEKKLEARFP